MTQLSSPSFLSPRSLRPLLVAALAVAALATLATLTAAPASAAPPFCGDGACNGGETCDGTDFCKATSCPAGTEPVCDALCGGYTCESTGGGGGGGGGGGTGDPAGTAELLFTDRSDDVAETNITALEQRLLDLIDTETIAIQASIDGLSRSNVVDRLVAAHQRGVTVEVTVDCQIYVADANPYYAQLASAGIPIVDDNDTFDGPSVNPGCTDNFGSGFVHNKFLVFEGQQTVWTGSTNLTDFGFNSSQNTVVVLADNPGVVDFFQAEFYEMFGDGVSLRDGGTGRFGQDKTLDPGIGSFTLADGSVVEVAFSPYNSSTTSDTEVLMNNTIDSAADELMWTTFFLTYDEICQRIDDNGATVKRGAVDPRTTDDFNDTALLIGNGEDVLVTNFLGTHHWKMIIADPDAADGQVLVGSHNFSNSSFNYNNENGVRILSPALAADARTAFDVVWNDPQNTGLVNCIHPGESYNENSRPLHRCNDNYDNDFDGYVDGNDFDCDAPFTCGTACQPSGATCSDDADCCSGTCERGRFRTCA